MVRRTHGPVLKLALALVLLHLLQLALLGLALFALLLRLLRPLLVECFLRIVAIRLLCAREGGRYEKGCCDQ